MLIWAYPILWQGDFCGPVWNGFVDINNCKVRILCSKARNFSGLAGWLDDGLMDRYCERARAGERERERER